ncbi:DNA ligase D [Halobacillus sp. Marseille-Q1614]|uniref:DNA ligase D n=1 Tax=Halobacillus sp. Marseille-Q1614 TaxID=2709134 RepID=UPI00156F2B95|nr:DNA ligase D [Halobacillus sp. Marseille-Q1614]
MFNRPMLPTLTNTPPKSKEWSYEIKYDGFRVLLHWTTEGITLTSRNGKNLTAQFPEITDTDHITPPTDLPLLLDGELVILNNPYQANFELVQQRGRTKRKDKVKELSKKRPAKFMAFDLLYYQEDRTAASYAERKKFLKKAIANLNHPHIQEVPFSKKWNEIYETAFDHLSEGIVVKQNNSTYTYNKRSKQWLKIKLWRTVSGFLTEYHPENDYYTVEIYEDDSRVPLGRFKNGLDDDQSTTLRTFFKDKGVNWRIDPCIVVDIHCLGVNEGEFREPLFSNFRFDLSPEDCTEDKLNWDLALLPENVEFTTLDKPLWPPIGIRKRDYLIYLRRVFPYMKPFLIEKKLTVIRYPHGIEDESFFQKHLPDYAPDYVKGWKQTDGDIALRADELSPLLWLGNQGALELHLPFQRAEAKDPDEIVFDLDPPDRSAFHLAVLAAQLLKHLLDKLEVNSFVKTSGNKGLQIHIPITEGSLTYSETRRFTERLASLLTKEKPDLFTIERLKKNRGDRLYIDYVQHAEGKTIIAPYSARATNEASVATPIFWSELNDQLSPADFTIENVIERVYALGCPFQNYHECRKLQPVDTIKEL